MINIFVDFALFFRTKDCKLLYGTLENSDKNGLPFVSKKPISKENCKSQKKILMKRHHP